MSSSVEPFRWKELSPLLEPLLEERALAKLHTLKSVKQHIQQGWARWWPMKKSCMVTEIIEYPEGRVFRIWLAAGDLDELTENQDLIARYAKEDLGCVSVEILGRPGWIKVLDKFTERGRIYVREL